MGERGGEAEKGQRGMKRNHWEKLKCMLIAINLKERKYQNEPADNQNVLYILECLSLIHI